MTQDRTRTAWKTAVSLGTVSALSVGLITAVSNNAGATGATYDLNASCMVDASTVRLSMHNNSGSTPAYQLYNNAIASGLGSAAFPYADNLPTGITTKDVPFTAPADTWNLTIGAESFTAVVGDLNDCSTIAPTATATATVTASPSATPTVTVTATPSATPTVTVTATPSPTRSSATPTPTRSATPTPTPTLSPSPTPTRATPTPSPTPSRVAAAPETTTPQATAVRLPVTVSNAKKITAAVRKAITATAATTEPGASYRITAAPKSRKVANTLASAVRAKGGNVVVKIKAKAKRTTMVKTS